MLHVITHDDNDTVGFAMQLVGNRTQVLSAQGMRSLIRWYLTTIVRSRTIFLPIRRCWLGTSQATGMCYTFEATVFGIHNCLSFLESGSVCVLAPDQGVTT